MKRALIVKMGAIGDVVMAIPGGWELHRAGYEVDWVCGAGAAQVLAFYPWVKRIEVDERAILKGSGRGAVAGRFWGFGGGWWGRSMRWWPRFITTRVMVCWRCRCGRRGSFSCRMRDRARRLLPGAAPYG